MLARSLDVDHQAPRIDGRRLDDIVDYLNYVMVPVVFLMMLGSLPHWSVAAAPLLASAYGFSQREAKTRDAFFLGWPSYWNVVALYCWLLDLSTATTTFWVVVCSLAIFLPLKYAYPSKVKDPVFMYTLTIGGFAWAGLLGLTILAPTLSAQLHLVEISFTYLVYYMGLSVWLGDWKHGWK